MCCEWLKKLFKETTIKPVKVPSRTVTVKITKEEDEVIEYSESIRHPVGSYSARRN